MLKSYLKIGFRNLARQKLYSSINIGGLGLGIACAILIFIWVQDELRYDRFHVHADTLYRLNWDFKWNGNEGVGPGTPPPLAAALSRETPDVVQATRIFPVPPSIVRYEDKFFNEQKILGVDTNFFELFSFNLLAGSPRRVLAEPNSAVVTQGFSHKYFGDQSPLGKIITIGEDRRIFGRACSSSFTVTGVVESPPRNSHIQFDLLTSMSSHPQVAFFDWSWIWMQVVTYVRIKEGIAPGAVEAKIPPLVKRYAPAAFKRVGFSYDELMSNGGRWRFALQPLTDVYLGSTAIGNRLGPTGSRNQVFLFSIIAIFILVIACINFMNLATARSANRAREIGVRKVLGSQKRMIVFQFLIESFLYSFLSLPFALFLVELFLRPFSQLAGKPLEFSIVDPLWLPGALIVLTSSVGLIAGLCPGFYLSSLMPAEVVKGSPVSSLRSRKLRNALVVFQFAVTIGLIACTLLVKRQMDFIRNADLGFDQKGIVVISNDNNRLGDKAKAFRDALMSHSQVVNASITTGVPPNGGFQDYYKVEGRGDEQFDLISYMTDDYFLNTMGITLTRGRGFSPGYADSASVILNEAAVKYFGLNDPIARTITYPSSGTFTVIGVMKDFNFATLYSPITPFALFHSSSKSYTLPSSSIVVRVHGGDLPKTIAILASEWRAYAPAAPFEYAYLDATFEAEYLSSQRLGKVFLVFSALTILIACIGLLGLAAYSTEQRTKEIGIRKVLGASLGDIVGLLSKDFIFLVIVANALAWPASWYVMHQWLQDFAYRVDIAWEIFATAGSMAIAIAMLTVSTHAIKAALSDPVKALRCE